MIAILQLASLVYMILLFMVYLSQPCKYNSLVLEALGFGYLVYSSLTCKTRWALSLSEAIEWVGCMTEGDSIIFVNRSKEVHSVRFAPKRCVNFS